MNTETSTPLNLLQIAAWQLPALLEAQDLPFVAELPSLQRESVWKPSQIEFLWDSIFMGFPIGSLVISRYLGSQRFRAGSVAPKGESRWSLLPQEKKRALLDGQQRCNAIALGFLDPQPQKSNGESQPAILWIDLKPNLPENSTRKFLFRVTTTSHPWGYQKSDAAPRLDASQLRRNLEGGSYWTRHGRSRPKPSELYPFEAEVPIPLAWLLSPSQSSSSGQQIWDYIQDRCAESSLPWQKRVYDALSNRQHDEALCASLDRIEIGLTCAKEYELVALKVPDGTLDREEADASLSCIENLFERLNNGGTRISTEDLAYSMIKAYWPGIEERVDSLTKRPISASKLFQLGARAAAYDPSLPKLRGVFGIPQLRRIARATSEKDNSLRNLMLRYFGISEDGSTRGLSPFVEGVSLCESWLLYRSATVNDFGLPPLVRSQIVQRSPDTYLLLLLLAKRYPKDSDSAESIRKLIIALVTSLHWFSEDAEGQVIERILKRLPPEAEFLNEQFFAGIWEDFVDLASPDSDFMIPQTPARLKEELPGISLSEIETWSWDSYLISSSFKGIMWNKEFLLYAQRSYLDSEFQGFDAADIKAGEDHNRPWDYDHLLPQSHFYDRRKWGKERLGLCKTWGHSIGNFHVLPFEVNRARGNKPLKEFLEELNPLKSPVRSEDVLAFTEPPDKSDDQLIKFAKACQQRVIDIYEDWFESLGISFLLGNAEKLKQERDDRSMSHQ